MKEGFVSLFEVRMHKLKDLLIIKMKRITIWGVLELESERFQNFSSVTMAPSLLLIFMTRRLS